LERKRLKNKEFDDKQNRSIVTILFLIGFNVKQNNEALEKQLEERRLTKLAEKEQQDNIAKQYQNEVNKLMQQDIDQKNKLKEQQANYFKDLNSQLKEKKMK